jgi:hypothetical protein
MSQMTTNWLLTTWELRTPRDMFEKARRELRRFGESAANNEREQIDHALNFAIPPTARQET